MACRLRTFSTHFERIHMKKGYRRRNLFVFVETAAQIGERIHSEAQIRLCAKGIYDRTELG
jgi:hypothetical protein